MIYLFRRALPGGSSFRIRILSAHVWPEETCPFLILFSRLLVSMLALALFIWG